MFRFLSVNVAHNKKNQKEGDYSEVFIQNLFFFYLCPKGVTR